MIAYIFRYLISEDRDLWIFARNLNSDDIIGYFSNFI